VKIAGLAIVAFLLLVVDHAGLSPYSTPVVERPAPGDPGGFDGLLDLAAMSSPSSPVRVLWTHGMCTHPPTWADDRLQRLLSAMGGTAETQSVRAIGSQGASIRTERISTPAGTIDVSFLTWSPLTAAFKARLDHDASTVEAGWTLLDPATLNRELKRGLVNNCLTDVVVYSGPNGREIREAAIEAMCGVLGGRFDGLRCDMAEADAPPALAFVGESLGSKLLFDAITNIWETAERNADKVGLTRLANSLAGKRIIYMLANQVPLLVSAGRVPAEAVATGEASTPGSPSTDGLDVFRILARAPSMAPHPSGPPTVVAFSDPNDILSYRIVPQRLPEGLGLREFRIVNVLVSNDTTYFGYFERPDTAHCGYPWNSHVLGMVAKGYRPGQRFPVAFETPGGSCLKALGLIGSAN